MSTNQGYYDYGSQGQGSGYQQGVPSQQPQYPRQQDRQGQQPQSQPQRQQGQQQAGQAGGSGYVPQWEIERSQTLVRFVYSNGRRSVVIESILWRHVHDTSKVKFETLRVGQMYLDDSGNWKYAKSRFGEFPHSVFRLMVDSNILNEMKENWQYNGSSWDKWMYVELKVQRKQSPEQQPPRQEHAQPGLFDGQQPQQPQQSQPPQQQPYHSPQQFSQQQRDQHGLGPLPDFMGEGSGGSGSGGPGYDDPY